MHGSYGFCNRKICSYRDDFMRHWIPTGHTSSQDVYEPRYPQAATINSEAAKHKKLIALPPVLVEGLRNKKESRS